jgi:hypothetical protein
MTSFRPNESVSSRSTDAGSITRFLHWIHLELIRDVHHIAMPGPGAEPLFTDFTASKLPFYKRGWISPPRSAIEC